jgi:RNA polymerase sigma-70 factor (ECF subfamily)
MDDFEDVYRKHVDAVFRYAVHCAGRREVAEDITSEAFLALFREFETVTPSQLPGWLFTAVKRRAIDYWRHEKVAERHIAAQDREARREEAQDAPFEIWLAQSKTLKPIHRACLILRYVHCLERVEIAHRLGCSEFQVKGYLQYARSLLRKELVGSDRS